MCITHEFFVLFFFSAKFPYLHYVVYNNSAPLRPQRAPSQDRVNGGGAKDAMLEATGKSQLIDILNSQGQLSNLSRRNSRM